MNTPDEQESDTDSTPRTPTLPTEVLSQIARHLKQSDLASCTLASSAFLDIFGKILHRNVDLWDISDPQSCKDSTPHPRLDQAIRKRFLSFVQILDMDPHGVDDFACVGIAKLCSNLRILAVADMGVVGPRCGLSESCGCLPTDGRDFKLLLQH